MNKEPTEIERSIANFPDNPGKVLSTTERREIMNIVEGSVGTIACPMTAREAAMALGMARVPIDVAARALGMSTQEFVREYREEYEMGPVKMVTDVVWSMYRAAVRVKNPDMGIAKFIVTSRGGWDDVQKVELLDKRDKEDEGLPAVEVLGDTAMDKLAMLVERNSKKKEESDVGDDERGERFGGESEGTSGIGGVPGERDELRGGPGSDDGEPGEGIDSASVAG